MKILFLGDVMGRAGRTAVIEALPDLRERLKLDFVIVNAENSAAGFGMTTKIGEQLFEAGADCITLGDHAFDQKDMMSHITTEPRILRPLNYAKSAPGTGARLFDAPRGKKVLVMQALGRVFMRQPFDCPFSALEAQYNKLAHAADAVVIDFHAEVTSETMAMGHYFDGKASLVVGTHTHVPTADTQILPRGTAFQSDAGMCGDYDSIIGMDKTEPMRRFVTGMQGSRFTPAEGPATICGVYIETDNTSKRATRVSPVRIGGRLAEIIPA
ncbi:MAG: TIGR00282 family metallophosphoesterase [Pikeienuella sp.]